MVEFEKKMDIYIRGSIEGLEKAKKKIENQISKIIANYSSKDIEKLNKLSNETNEINKAIYEMYVLIGGMSGALKSK